MKKVVFLTLLAFALLFSACATKPNQMVASVEQSKALGFYADEKSVLQNPPSEEFIRLYVARPDIFKGSFVKYSIGIDYEPIISEDNKLLNYREYGEYLDRMGAGAKIIKDIKINENKPLALVTSRLDTGGFSFLYFIPKGGKIYCVKAEVVAGNFIGRPYISFAEQAYCEKAFRKHQVKKEEK